MTEHEQRWTQSWAPPSRWTVSVLSTGGWVTLLKSTLLLSLLTPTLDGLLSIALLPSRLFGTEFGDTSGPGRDRRRRVKRQSGDRNFVSARQEMTGGEQL